MRKLVLIVHTSVDGFIADENGSFAPFNPSPENLDFVCGLTDTADMLLAGRVSYQMLEAFWPTAKDKFDATESEIRYSNWYNSSKKIVLSNTMRKDRPDMIILNKDIPDEIRRLKQQGDKSILMFGSPTAFQTLHQHDLIDEYQMILYPEVFGRGIPLFSRDGTSKRLELVSTKQLTKGEIAMNFKVLREQ